MQMKIYDSVKKEKVPFIPIREGEATIYVCGPTVYDDAHLGHARSALSFDLLTRTLKALGYRTTLAKNFTDIDDKIIKKMSETGMDLRELTQMYIDKYLDEMAALNVKRADIEPKATESLDAIENMINRLTESGCAYKISNGDVYFDTSKDGSYGSISHIKSDNNENISRVSHANEKRDPKDFALWKACSGDNDVCFHTSLGKGRPGWHIECSAMIEKHFRGDGNYTIDIHGGGADLLFPHHENEAAQTRCSTGHEIAKYWMHNGFVQIDGEKMSKSLGNSFFLKDALAVYPGELLRFYLISVHYRNDFNFNEVDLQAAKKRLDKLYRLKMRLIPAKASTPSKSFTNELSEAMADDLNSSKALAAVDAMISEANERLDREPKNKALKKEIAANIEFVDTLLGFGGSDPYEWFQHGISPEDRAEIEKLIEERDIAKREKNYEKADSIRAKLSKMGISLMDTHEGTKWEKSQSV